jgi:hypothetical protein
MKEYFSMVSQRPRTTADTDGAGMNPDFLIPEIPPEPTLQ